MDGRFDGWMDGWMDKAAGKGGCNGGERRAWKAKWIMRMRRTDETCSAAYLLLLMLLLLRLLTGLRSANGVREPRCVYSPSPPPWIGNDLCLMDLHLLLSQWHLGCVTSLHVLIPTGLANLQVFGFLFLLRLLLFSIQLLVSAIHQGVPLPQYLLHILASPRFFIVFWSNPRLYPPADV